jgi:phosphatidylserine decarboxylase
VKYVQYHPGSFFIAKHPKASLLNEMSTTVIETEDKKYVMIRQIAGAVARRIVTYVNEGVSVQQGGELGFIRFGSRVDILVPESCKILVKPGMRVKAGTDIIAEW